MKKKEINKMGKGMKKVKAEMEKMETELAKAETEKGKIEIKKEKMKMILYKTVYHFFPSFGNWLKAIEDPRNKNMIRYSILSEVWVGLLLFLLKIEARRQINYQFNTEEFVKNLSVLAKEELKKIPHDGTLAYLMKRVDPAELSKLRAKMIDRLIRMKCLVNYRLFGYYTIAIDGTGHLAFNHPHCEHCLRMKDKKTKKTIYWYHPVLEAKLVAPNGIALSMATEFIENPSEKVTRQDCELKAFHRLAKRLKRDFPQLKMCLLLDAIYANKPVFDVCEKNHWKHIITFKEGSMPDTFQEYLRLKPLNPDCKGKYEFEGVKQIYHWVNDIDYEDHLLDVLECKETKDGEAKTFVWLTNFDIDKGNFHCLGNEGGRLRWKIENQGFNTQKNGGYELEHAYSEDEVGIKNFYLLLQIAHIINQLMEKGSLLMEEIKKSFGSIRNIARRLLEDLRTSVFMPAVIQSAISTPFQIRLRGP